jgi:small subunit ribosomal protein S5
MQQNSKSGSADPEVQALTEKVIQIDRVTKVVSGGKRMAFRAFVISGDEHGRVGYGLGKSKEVPNAIRKAVEKAKKSLLVVNLNGGTLPHIVEGKFGASRVILKPARPGTGVIAGGSARIILESVGLKDVVAKALGSNNSVNCAKATMIALSKCKNLDEETKLRGKTLSVYQAV